MKSRRSRSNLILLFLLPLDSERMQKQQRNTISISKFPFNNYNNNNLFFRLHNYYKIRILEHQKTSCNSVHLECHLNFFFDLYTKCK